MHRIKVSNSCSATSGYQNLLQCLQQPLGFGSSSSSSSRTGGLSVQPTACKCPGAEPLHALHSMLPKTPKPGHAALGTHLQPAAAVSVGLPGGSPPASIARQHLNRLSLNRHHHHRCSLSAQAVMTWLQRHAAVASGTSRLLLDLQHHSYHDFDRQCVEQLLGALPQLASVCLVGVVEGTDAYEPLGEQLAGQLAGVFAGAFAGTADVTCRVLVVACTTPAAAAEQATMNTS
jgi:hypothetical protein